MPQDSDHRAASPLLEPTDGEHTGPFTTRRRFLRSASALSLALAACSRGEQPPSRTGGATAAGPHQARGTSNPDSPLDTTLHHTMPSSTTAGVSAAAPALTPTVPFHAFDAALPPVSAERTTRLHFTSKEVPVRINESTVVAAWTFEGDVPGPIVHVRQGDTVEFTLTNRGRNAHSMDFHAARIDPKTAFRSVLPGESVTFRYVPRYAGAFLYHCGTAPVLLHLGSGMLGAVVVDPPAPLPPAREFVLIENEYYLGAPQNGVYPIDYNKMLATLPDYFAFNGRPDQYQAAPLRAKLGERVRFYVVNAGPTHPCAFHVVGQQFDTVYLGAPPGNAIHGVQTFEVAAGGGMIFELMADVAGEFVFVNHAFGHGQKGAIGRLVVEA